MRPEDRAVIGDYAMVAAVAASLRHVYVVGPDGLALYDPIARAWEVPRVPPDPFLLREATLALADPVDEAVWIATRRGWARYDPDSDLWERGPLPGAVDAAGFDPADPLGGPWFRTTAGWVQQGRAGPALPGAPPRSLQRAPTLEDAYQAIPILRSVAPTLAIGPGLRPGRLTSAAPSPDRRGWYVGTTTRGLLFVDGVTGRAEPVPLGLNGEVVGALLLTATGLWVATDADAAGRPPAVTWVAPDLSRYEPYGGAGALDLPFAASRAILAGDRVLHLATDRGVATLPLDAGRPRLAGEGSGLPTPFATALAAWGGEIAVGTTRGLARLDGTGGAARLAPALAVPIRALLPRRDTLWVASGVGLGALLPGDSTVRTSAGWRALARGAVPVVGVAFVGDTLVAMLEDRLAWRDPVGGGWMLGPDLGAGVGRLRVLAPTADGLWVGGDRGAAFVPVTTAPLRILTVGRELPAPVTALAADAEHLWVGTTAGLVRVALRR